VVSEGAAAVRVPPRARPLLRGPMRVLLAPAGPIRGWLERLLAVQAVDRGVALGALAFSAIFPLMIVYGAVVPFAQAHSFAEELDKRLHLTGAVAHTVSEAFAPPAGGTSGVTALGVVLVLVSALSLARGVQRLYELSYKLPPVGVRGTPWHLLWVALIPVYISVRPLVVEIAGGWWHIAGSLLLGTLAWLATPYVLLGRRLSWRRLAPGGILTGIAMTVLGVVSLVYLPHSVSSSASRYGTIGVAFALLSWLILTGFVLVGSATGGAVALEWLEARR
jgi:membrane protein